MRELWPTPDDLVDPTGAQLDAARNFCRRIDQLRAVPISHVSYRREAWFSPGQNAVRVTLDRDIVCEPRSTYSLSTDLKNASDVFDPGEVILEIKFTERFPAWLAAVVWELGLVRTSAAKYVDGVTHANVENFVPAMYSR